MAQYHVVVTGGASGLGLGCARLFRKLGYDLTLADVDKAASESARTALAELPGKGQIHLHHLDLSDPLSISRTAKALLVHGRPIDVLVNNAGIYPPAIRQLTAEGHELSFAIAHLGHFRLTNALWPLLESAPSARVISISSLVQRRAAINLDDLTMDRGYSPIRAYQQTKLACLLFAFELHRRLERLRHRVNSYAAHPGVCRTNIGSNRPRSASDNVWQSFASTLLAGGLRYIGQSPESGARPVVAVATSSDFAPGSFVGPRWLNESFGEPVRIAPGRAARDTALAASLWARSEQLTGVQWDL